MDEKSERVVASTHKEDEDLALALRKKEERDWSDLPSDILRHIIGKLFWSDRIRMRAACKSWSLVSHHGIPTIGEWISYGSENRGLTVDKHAWRMDFLWQRESGIDGVISLCKLTDMSNKRAAIIEFGIKGEERAIFHGACFHASRYGWVLFHKHGEKSRSICFFLYSPFSDEVIELPKLDLDYAAGGWWLSLVATFYLSSANSDCLVFCLHRKGEKMGISTCRPADETWKTLEFQVSHSYCKDPRHATYVAGSFYCVFLGGALGAFNLARQQWTVLVNSWPDSGFHLAELIAIPRCLSRVRYDSPEVFKFDFSKKRWVEEIEEVLSDHDLRILSSSQAMGEEESEIANIDLYTCRYATSSVEWFYTPLNKRLLNVIVIEPPLKGIWRRRDLLQRS